MMEQTRGMGNAMETGTVRRPLTEMDIAITNCCEVPQSNNGPFLSHPSRILFLSFFSLLTSWPVLLHILFHQSAGRPRSS
jgi:hypothetical protein